MRLVLGIFFVLGLSGWALPSHGTDFSGRFNSVYVETGEDACLEIFDPREYDVRFIIFRETTSVLYFTDLDERGWFHDRRFVGGFDGSNIYVVEDVMSSSSRHEVRIEGIGNSEVLLLDFNIVEYDRETDEVICHVVGEYSAFE